MQKSYNNKITKHKPYIKLTKNSLKQNLISKIILVKLLVHDLDEILIMFDKKNVNKILSVK